jgi:hypothetical protein
MISKLCDDRDRVSEQIAWQNHIEMSVMRFKLAKWLDLTRGEGLLAMAFFGGPMAVHGWRFTAIPCAA